MPSVSCPFPDCNWKSDNLSDALGSVLTQQLIMHDKAVHQAAPKPEKPKLKIDPPRLGIGASPEEWAAFKRQWKMYKEGTGLADSQLSTALFYSCSEDLRQDLMRDIQSDISDLTETALLAEIKKLSVKEESVLVHRMRLSKMTQSPGMSIRTFLANLKGQASLCQFTAKCTEEGCTHIFNYSKEVIKDNLIRGIADPEILADLLGDAKTDRSLEEVVSFIAQKEQGKATRSAIGDCTAHIRADLKKAGHSNSNNPRTMTPQTQSKCWACGNQIHAPKNDKATRAKKCPAWSSTCTRCNVKGHFTKNCSKCVTCGMWGHRDDKSYFCKKKSTLYMEDDNFAEQLTTISEVPECLGAVDHHIFEDGRWIQRPSKPHPMVTATLTAVPEDHAEFGHPIDPSQSFRNVTILMVADSGCQSCILPMETVLSMGYTEDLILPVSLMMKGAISENLEVAGGIVAIIRIGDETGESKMTRQLIYVSRKIEKAFLCREAMAQLGIISPDFPKVPPPLNEACLSGEDECSCPKRCPQPPPMPRHLPEGLRPIEEDVPKLRNWLLQYYSSTTFNTCEHQKLPMMKGPPLKLHITPDAKPVAVHKPATVPVHW